MQQVWSVQACDCVLATDDAGLACGIDACDGERWVTLDVCVQRGLDGAERPRAGLHRVCLVDQAGSLHVALVAGDAQLQSPGWTHSAWDNGNVRSTLSTADEARCEAALMAVPTGTALPCRRF